MTNNLQFWGEVTSTLDWCEDNYQFSTYLAEFANTISNIPMIVFGFYGFQKVLAQSFPNRYIASYLGLSLVGIGSTLFHATLLYEAQLADELPIYVSTQNLYILLATAPRALKAPSRQRSVAIILVISDLVFTLLYSIYRNPIFHQIVFAVIMLAIVARASFLSHHASSNLSTTTRQEIGGLLWSGSCTFIFGFTIWNLDNIYCDSTKQWKAAMGWPAAVLLEGHAWWHILTAIGVYLLMVGVQYLTLCVSEGQDKFEIVYNVHVPYVTRRSNGGKLKK